MTQTIPLPPEIEASDVRRLVEKMLIIRRMEEAMIALYRRNRIPGFIHPGIGEEAVHVGVCDLLDERDHIAATHRGHGQALAKGVDPNGLMAEVLGRSDGVLGGRGGSLHVGDWARGVLPASPLVGGGLGTMTGVALAHQLFEDEGIAVCFFGDGAANRGSFHEAINIASLWKLPIVYACIDNGWAISVPRTGSTAGDLEARATGYGLPGQIVDGKDLLSCRAAAAGAIARARAGTGPSLLIFDCPRGYGHEEGDAQHYRDPSDYQAALARDPIPIAITHFRNSGLMSESDLDEIEERVAHLVNEAVRYAEASSLPEPSTALDYVRPTASKGE